MHSECVLLVEGSGSESSVCRLELRDLAGEFPLEPRATQSAWTSEPDCLSLNSDSDRYFFYELVYSLVM